MIAAASFVLLAAGGFDASAVRALQPLPAMPVSEQAAAERAAAGQAAAEQAVAEQAAAEQAAAPAAPVARAAETPPEAFAAPAAITAAERRQALSFDPRALPRAAPQRWKDYERMAASALPEGLLRVRDAIVAQDFVAAIAGLHDVLRREPDFPPALHQLGVAYFRIQRYGDSIVALERYLELAPHRVGDTRVLGHDFYSLGRYAEARAHYERVLAVAPSDAEAGRGLALALWRTGAPGPALEQLEGLLERDPRLAEAWLARGSIQFDLEQGREALECARRAVELEPFEERGWYLLAQAAGECGAEDEGRTARARHAQLSDVAQACRGIEVRLQTADDPGAPLAQLLELRRSIGDRAGALDAARRLVRAPTTSVTALERALQELDVDPSTRAAAAAAAERLRALAAGGHDPLAAWRALVRHYARIGDVAALRAAEAQLHNAEALAPPVPR